MNSCSARTCLLTCALAGLALAAPAAAVAADAAPFDVAAHYEKSEHRVAMRDGTKLFTIVYTPKDKSRRYPVLLRRTPYSIAPYGVGRMHTVPDLAPSEAFLRDGYIIAMQDARGRYKSEGDWVDFRPLRTDQRGVDETTDTFDSIEWLVKSIGGNNGRVGLWGISYDGWYAAMGIIDPHPALKAASPQATTADGFIGDDSHFNGAFILMLRNWVESMERSAAARGERAEMKIDATNVGTPWAYEFYLGAGPTHELDAKHFGGNLGRQWADLIEHADYDDYWVQRDMLAPLENVRVPVLNVSGWFDTYDLFGSMATYKAIEKSSPRNASTIVTGPWRHGAWLADSGESLGDIRFGSRTSDYFREHVIFPFFQHHLKGGRDWAAPEAVMFATGSDQWHTFKEWPPKQAIPTAIYLGSEGRLSFGPPQGEGHDAYLSDPAKPVPYSPEISMESGDTWRIDDQRMNSTRPDVLTYRTEPLERDITVAGPIDVHLFASTSGTDSDWVVKIIDVLPGDTPDLETPKGTVKMGGYQMLVGMEIMRGKYRNSFVKPEPMQPGVVTPIRYEILDRFHTFRKGHRIMVQVQSSFFPFIDRNPQTFTNIYKALPHEYRKAEQHIHRSATAPSHLVLPVLAPDAP